MDHNKYTILFYSGYVNMQKYDNIKEKTSNEIRFMHDTIQIEIKFVVFVKIIEKSWQVWYHSKHNIFSDKYVTCDHDQYLLQCQSRTKWLP